jgi:hypothetical protein
MKRFLLTSALLLLASPAWAALANTNIFEVNSAGDNTNASCFAEGATGSDNTYPTPTVTTYTDLVIDATTNTQITSAANPFSSVSPGRCVRISGGTGFTVGLYSILSQAAGVATLDRAVGTVGSTGGTGKSGGAIATLAQLNTDMCNGCRAWVKADGTYSMSAKVTFSYSSSGRTWIAGYTSTRDDGGKATLQASTAFGDYLVDANFGSALGTIRNFIFDVNSQGSSTRCLRLSREFSTMENIECKNATAPGASLIRFDNHDQIGRNVYVHDSAYGGTVGVVNNNNANNVVCYGCVVSTISGNSAIGFYGLSCFDCVVDTMTGTTTDGFLAGNALLLTIDHCVVFNVTRNAVNLDQSGSKAVVTNCIFSTVLNGINSTGGTTFRAGDFFNDYNFLYGVTGTAYTNVTAGSHSGTLSIDPFQAASSRDFRLNNKATGGGAVRAHGTPSSLPGITGTFYPDPGVAQHQDPKFGALF